MTAPAGGIAIRPATPADAPLLAEMTVEFETLLHGLCGGATVMRPPPQTEETFRRMAFGAERCFTCEIALLGADPVGFLSHFIGYDADHGARTLFIPDLFVRDGARGRGIGRALMTKATEIARGQGATLIRWTVWSRNSAAVAFYEKLGAKYDREEISAFWPAADWPV